MSSNRVYNAIKNTKWGVAEKVITFGCPFVIRTLLIFRLGADFSGISGLFVSVLSFLNLAEMGLSNAIIFHMYKPISENDIYHLSSLLYFFRKAYRIIGLVILLLGILLCPFIHHFIKGEVPIGINIYVVFLVYLINSVIGYFFCTYKLSILSAYQREDIISKNLLVYNIMLCIIQCLAIYISNDYYIFILVVPICTCVLNFLYHLSAKKIFPYKIEKGVLSDDEIKSLKKEIYGLMIWKVGGESRNSFDNIFISTFLGLVAITMYQNYFQIISGVNMLIAVVSRSIIAGVGTKIVEQSIERNYEDFKKFHFLYMWIASWCTICIFCLTQPFMRLWMGEKLMLPDYMIYIFSYYFIMMKKGDINSVYYNAAGLWWNGRYRSIFEAVLNLILNYLLGRYFGLAGIILATIISFSVVNVYGASVLFSKYFKNNGYLLYFFENVFFIIITFLLSAFTRGTGNRVINLFKIDSSYLSIVVLFILCIFLPNLCMAIIYGIFPKYRKYMLYACKIFMRTN